MTSNPPPGSTDILEWALYYASIGLRIFPAHAPVNGGCTCGKKSCSNIGKHPKIKDWAKEATTDPIKIYEWFGSGAIANIAMPTDDIYVVDADIQENYEHLQSEHGLIPVTPRAWTGGGGLHDFFINPGPEYRNTGDDSPNRLGGGIHTRGHGGLVILPPSLHQSGKRYEWNPFAILGKTNLAPLPDWMRLTLSSKNGHKPAISQPQAQPAAPIVGNPAKWFGEALERAHIGCRNTTGAWLAAQLRDDGIELNSTMALYYPEKVPQLPDKPYTRQDWEATCRSIYSQSKREPARNVNKSPAVNYDPPPPEPPDDWPALEQEPPPDSPVLLHTTEQPARQNKTRWTIAELYDAVFPEPRFAIPGIVPEGLTILAGRPKIGKSWFSLNMSHAVGTGGRFLDRQIDKGNVFYLALEDNPRRLQQRIKLLKIDRDAQIIFENNWKPLNKGGLDDLVIELERQEYRLVVIDTISRALRGVDLKKDQATVSGILDSLQSMALNRGIAIVCNDHTRKPDGNLSDPIDDVLNSTEKTALADAILAIYKEQGKTGAQLKGRGRDIEDVDYIIEWDRNTLCWQLRGETGELRITDQREKIMDALREIGKSQCPVVAKYTSIERSQCHRQLVALYQAGRIERESLENKIYYWIKDENNPQ